MTVHENHLSKQAIQMQDHDIVGLTKAVDEKEKVNLINKQKIDEYQLKAYECSQEKDELENNLFHYKSESNKKTNYMENNFSERASQLQHKTQKFMDQINQLEVEMKSHLNKAKHDVKLLHDQHNCNITETQIKYENKISDNQKEHLEKKDDLMITLHNQDEHINYLNETN
jgi:hypothetical protein